MLRIIVIPIILLGLLAGSMIWSGEGSADRAGFAYIIRDNITLDLNDMSYGQDIRLAYALWEGLYTPDPVTAQPVLGTADSVQVSPDHKVYTFHIRNDARWSNGDPVLADDFIFSWRRMLESPKEYSYLHYYIKGAKAYEEAFAIYTRADQQHKPALPDFATVGEERVDSHTLRVTLTDPVPFFSALLSFTPFYPMHEKSMLPFKEIDSTTGAVSYRPEFTRPPHLVTNGKYRLAEWLFKRRLRLIANDYFWDRVHVKTRVIDEVHADDPVAAYRLYQQGDVDWIAAVDPEIAATIHKNFPQRTDLHIFPGFGTQYFEINCEAKLPDGRVNPLADRRVRQALDMAIDKVPIIRDVARLDQPLANTYVPVGAFAGYHSPPGLPYDPERARKLLAEAGYPGGKGFPLMGLLYSEDGVSGDIAVIARRQWANVLGVHIDAHSEEASQYRSDLHNHRYAIARANWSGDYLDPSTFSDKYLSNSANNSADWQNPQYDKLCAQAAVELDPAKRYALLSQAEELLLNDVPIIPLYTLVGAYLYGDDVKGMHLNPISTQMFQAIYVTRPQ